MRHWILALLAISAIVGCDDKKEQAKAQAEQQAATQKVTEAQREAEQKIATAKQEAQETAEKATHARATVKEAAQKDVDAIDRKIAYLRERAAKITGKKKPEVDHALKDVEAKREAVRTNMRKLDQTTGADWDAARAAVDRDTTALHASLDALESSVTGKPAH